MLDTPHNMEAERSVLGAMLFGETVDTLKPDHFYSDTHQLIFRAICDLRSKQTPVDTVTVRSRAMELGNRTIEVRTMLLIAETVPNTAHADHYAEIVRDLWERRTAVKVSEWLYQQAVDLSSDMEAARKRVSNWARKDHK